MKMYPTNYKGVRSHDHLCLGPDLTLVTCLSTGVCQAPRWTGLDKRKALLYPGVKPPVLIQTDPQCHQAFWTSPGRSLVRMSPDVYFSKHLVMQEIKQRAPCTGVGFWPLGNLVGSQAWRMWGPTGETVQDLGSNRHQTNGACWYLSQCLILKNRDCVLSDQPSRSLNSSSQERD